MLCNDVQREDVKPSPGVVPMPFCYIPLDETRYGIPVYEVALNRIFDGIGFERTCSICSSCNESEDECPL